MKNTFLIAMVVLAVSASAGDLKLPELLVTSGGETISTSEQWTAKRRGELLDLFRTQIYGRNPVDRPAELTFTVKLTDPKAMDGAATRKHVVIAWKGPGGEGALNLHLFTPNNRKPAPAFLLICNRPAEKNIDPTRQEKSPFWPAEAIIARGYAAAAFFNGDVDPDKDDKFKDGVHGVFDKAGELRAADAWGTIAAWAWGASRCMDYLETDADVDGKHVAVIGHSRGGKTALWCGAQDERFTLVISNGSGCAGAALSRNNKGESIEQINTKFPHWFCDNYKKFNGKDTEVPIDHHQLIALIAPRLAYVESATLDAWADPEGEFLGAYYSSPAWELFGKKGLVTPTPPVSPAPESPLHEGSVGYHLRTGKHDLTEVDWNYFMDFADKHGWKK